MPDHEHETAANPAVMTPRAETCNLMRTGLKAALATRHHDTGHAYVSLVTVATTPANEPLLLLSDLAVHTRNLKADPHASLLYDATSLDGDPLAGGRVTVMGHVDRLGRDSDKHNEAGHRFLARHPSAAQYAVFGDFAFYRLTPTSAHFIGGFGRIVDIPGSDLLTSTQKAGDLLRAHADIVEHMNEDHTDSLDLFAQALCAADPQAGSWRMTGIDPDGFDIVASDIATAGRTGAATSYRIDFDKPVRTPNEARLAFKALASQARSNAAPGS